MLTCESRSITSYSIHHILPVRVMAMFSSVVAPVTASWVNMPLSFLYGVREERKGRGEVGGRKGKEEVRWEEGKERKS